MTNALPGLALPIVLGVSTAAALWPQALLNPRRAALMIVAGVGLGVGLVSLATVLALPAMDRGLPTALPAGLEWSFCALAIGLAAIRIRRTAAVRAWAAQPHWHPSRVTAVLALLLAVAIVGALRLVAMRIMDSPHGNWDAWAVWNLHARFLYSGSPQWRQLFSPDLVWSHADYPLLLPATVARLWTILGHDSTAAPQAIAAVFTFASALVLFVALAELADMRSALTGAIVLLLTPQFVNFGAAQLADVPLSFFYVTALALLVVLLRQGQGRGLAILTGSVMGMAAWTKNEGICLAVAAAVALVVARRLEPTLRVARPAAVGLVAGALPFLVAGLYIKVLAPVSDIVAGLGAGTRQSVLDLDRYRLTAAALARGLWLLGDWQVPVLPLLAGVAVVCGARAAGGGRPGSRFAILVLGLILLQYCAVFIITPHDLAWHLTTWNRLLIQLYPSALLAYFMAVRLPGAEGAIRGRPASADVAPPKASQAHTA